jgi:hypothetical protein
MEKAVKEVRDKNATRQMMYLGMYSDYWKKMVSN